MVAGPCWALDLNSDLGLGDFGETGISSRVVKGIWFYLVAENKVEMSNEVGR